MKTLEYAQWKRAKALQILGDKELTESARRLLNAYFKEGKFEAVSILDESNERTRDDLDASFGLLRVKAITVAADEADKGQAVPEPTPPAQSPGDAAVAAFTTVTAPGGLFMRGVESLETLTIYLKAIPPATATPAGLKARQFNLEKYSYIRTDTTMRVFGGRHFGVLVDPAKVIGQVRYDTDKKSLAVHAEDTQSSRTATPTTAQEVDRVGDAWKELNGLVAHQNDEKRKNPAKFANWNEVEIVSAKADAYVGLFYAWPNVRAEYAKLWTPAERQALATLWCSRTGQRTLPIYYYRHQGKPMGSNVAKALATLGKADASTLALLEHIKP